jgi:hypothetical protein
VAVGRGILHRAELDLAVGADAKAGHRRRSFLCIKVSFAPLSAAKALAQPVIDMAIAVAASSVRRRARRFH